MERISTFLNLIRIKHWIKNFVIFLPLFFGKALTNGALFITTLLAFFSFSLVASAIYVFNDVQDYEMDKKSYHKKSRPIASGKVSKKNAYFIILIMLLSSFTISLLMIPLGTSELSLTYYYIYSTIYILLNIIYSCFAKNIPILDTIIIAAGFILRLLIGSVVTGISISICLYLTILAGAFFVSFSKRTNEFLNEKDSRLVLQKYSFNFLNYSSILFLVLTLLSYLWWCINHEKCSSLIISIPFILLILIRYYYRITKQEQSDPIEVIIKDKALYCLVILYVGMVSYILYFT